MNDNLVKQCDGCGIYLETSFSFGRNRVELHGYLFCADCADILINKFIDARRVETRGTSLMRRCPYSARRKYE